MLFLEKKEGTSRLISFFSMAKIQKKKTLDILISTETSILLKQLKNNKVS